MRHPPPKILMTKKSVQKHHQDLPTLTVSFLPDLVCTKTTFSPVILRCPALIEPRTWAQGEADVVVVHLGFIYRGGSKGRTVAV